MLAATRVGLLCLFASGGGVYAAAAPPPAEPGPETMVLEEPLLLPAAEASERPGLLPAPPPASPEMPSPEEDALDTPEEPPVDVPPHLVESDPSEDDEGEDAEAPHAGPTFFDPRDDVRHLAISEPEALGALSIGSPDGGLLLNPVAMPEGPLWTVRDPRESYGTAETIDYIARAIEAVEARHPGSPRLVIGDISRPDGGRLNRHKSHQAGRDADIGLYLKTGEAKTLVRPGRGQLDVARTWTLVRALVTETDVERIFIDRSLQRQLYAHAREAGEDKAWLDDLFGWKDGGQSGIIQHERRHQDHLHVRFYNPQAQEKGRLAYPTLVEAGVLPGPTVAHRVRSGETLGHLARRYGVSTTAIRQANGLRSSFLRAGRKYVIPVRKAPVTGAPVAVPPRRLPPGVDAREAEDAAEFAAPSAPAANAPADSSSPGSPPR